MADWTPERAMAALREPEDSLSQADCNAIANCMNKLCDQVATLSQRQLLEAGAGLQANLVLEGKAMSPDPFLCIAPACGPECSGCNAAIPPDAMRKNAVRYALLERMDPRFGMPVEWMRFKTLSEAVDSELAALAPPGTSRTTER